jgi:hypothetical protein
MLYFKTPSHLQVLYLTYIVCLRIAEIQLRLTHQKKNTKTEKKNWKKMQRSRPSIFHTYSSKVILQLRRTEQKKNTKKKITATEGKKTGKKIPNKKYCT